MQDRFKFRWFSKKYNQMFEVSRLEFPDTITYIDEYGNEVETSLSSDNGELIQSTGLTDKDGNLIYEHDIVRHLRTFWNGEEYSRNGLVCWDRTKWQIGLMKYHRPKAQPNRRYDRGLDFANFVSFADYTPIKAFAEVEIIGNVYTNPELLTEEVQA